ncbi:unnamed protein product, partial [Callosobruchus maculatus]
VKGGNLKFHCSPRDDALLKKWIGAFLGKHFVPGTRHQLYAASNSNIVTMLRLIWTHYV